MMKFELSEKQTEAWDILEQPDVRSLLFGGAKGGGKTILGCLWSYWMAKNIQKNYKVGKRKFPIPVGFMGRKRGVDFSDTTLETWKRFIPSQNYRIREQEKEIILDGGGVKLVYGGFDDQKTIQKFNSAEYGFFFIDQAEEITRDEIATLKATLRLKIDGKVIPPKELLTANPSVCWLKDEYISTSTEGKKFVSALPSDNENLPEGYIQQLMDAFKHRPELIQAYLYGSWDALAGADIVIRDIWVKNAYTRHFLTVQPKKIISVDPARFGDDETVIYYLENTNIKGEQIYGQKDTMETAGRAHILAREKGASLIAVDVIGIGAGIADRLREMGDKVLEINSAERKDVPDIYFNRRAQMWWEAGRQFAGGEIELTHQDPVLATQLSTPTYKHKNGKILIEDKEEIKKRLSRSPDRADAYIYGLYALNFAVIKKEGIQEDIYQPFSERFKTGGRTVYA